MLVVIAGLTVAGACRPVKPAPVAPATVAPASSLARVPAAPVPRPIVLYGYSGETDFVDAIGVTYRHGTLRPLLAVDRDDNLFVAETSGGVAWEAVPTLELLPGQALDRSLPVEPVPGRGPGDRRDTVVVTGAYVGRVTNDGRGVAWIRGLDKVGNLLLGANAGVPGFVIGAEAADSPVLKRDLTLAGVRIRPGWFVAAFDAAGDARWARALVPERPDERLHVERVLVAPSGEVVVLAEVDHRVRVQRLGPRGAVVWTRHYAGSLGEVSALAGGEGDAFGALDGEDLYLWFYPCEDQYGYGCDAILVRLDARGEEKWRTVVVGAQDRRSSIGAPHLAVGAGGDLYAALAYENGVHVGDHDHEWQKPSLRDFFDGRGAIFLSVTAAGKLAFHREFESDRHGLHVRGLAAGRGGRLWLTGTFRRYVDFDSDAPPQRPPLALLSPPRGEDDGDATQFLAAFDRDGRGLEAFPVAFGGYGYAMATGRDGALYLTTSHHGDLLLDGLRGRYKAGCAIVKLP